MGENGDQTRGDAAPDAEFALDALAEMARTLAHDLNQPLAAAANYLAAGRHLARRQAPGADALQESLEKAAGQIARASQAVRHMRLSLAPDAPELTEHSLHDLIRQTCASTEFANGKFDLRLVAADDRVLADAAQIENALKFAIAASGFGPEAAQIVTTRSDGRVIRAEIGAALPAGADGLAKTAGTERALAWALAGRILRAHSGEAQRHDGPDGPMIRLTLPLAAAPL